MFHSRQIKKVSNLIAEYTPYSENVRVEWLGPSQGIMKDLDKVNENI